MHSYRKRTIVASTVLVYHNCDSWNGRYGVEERQELVKDRSAFLDVFVSNFPLAEVMKAVCSSGELACAGLRSVNKISSCYATVVPDVMSGGRRLWFISPVWGFASAATCLC